MLWLKLKISRQIIIFIISIHILATIIWYQQPVLVIFIGLSLGFNLYRWGWLQTKNSIVAIKVNHNIWHIKTQNLWHKVTIKTSLQLWFVFISFTGNKKIFATLIAPDSLNIEMWRKIIIATKITH